MEVLKRKFKYATLLNNSENTENSADGVLGKMKKSRKCLGGDFINYHRPHSTQDLTP